MENWHEYLRKRAAWIEERQELAQGKIKDIQAGMTRLWAGWRQADDLRCRILLAKSGSNEENHIRVLKQTNPVPRFVHGVIEGYFGHFDSEMYVYREDLAKIDPPDDLESWVKARHQKTGIPIYDHLLIIDAYARSTWARGAISDVQGNKIYHYTNTFRTMIENRQMSEKLYDYIMSFTPSQFLKTIGNEDGRRKKYIEFRAVLKEHGLHYGAHGMHMVTLITSCEKDEEN